MSPPPDRTVISSRETHAWDLRCRGWTHSKIALELAITRSGVSRLLDRVEAREQARMSRAWTRIKLIQSAQLEWIIEEALAAWEKSKTPRKRAASKTVSGEDRDEVTTSEIVERDGDTSYLYAAMNAMDRMRSLWGLDVAPALQEPMGTISELTRDMAARLAAYEERTRPEADAPGDPPGDAGADPPGAGGVPE